VTNLGQQIVINFVMKAGQKRFICLLCYFGLNWFDDCSFLFLCSYFNNDSTSEI